MMLLLSFILIILGLYLGWMSADAENTYYETNDLCESDNEDQKQMCDENRSTWKMYSYAWKGTCCLAIILLLAAVFVPTKKTPIELIPVMNQ